MKKIIERIVKDSGAPNSQDLWLDDDNNLKVYANGGWRKISGGGGSDGIKYDEQQDLTSEEKAQARENIGAADAVTVQELEKEINGQTVGEWSELTSSSSISGYCLGAIAASQTVSPINNDSFCVATFDVIAGDTVRITAKKPAGSGAGQEIYTDFFVYAESESSDPSLIRVASGEAKESMQEGTLNNFVFPCSSDGYLLVVGDDSVQPKCEVYTETHIPGAKDKTMIVQGELGLEGNYGSEFIPNEGQPTIIEAVSHMQNGGILYLSSPSAHGDDIYLALSVQYVSDSMFIIAGDNFFPICWSHNYSDGGGK